MEQEPKLYYIRGHKTRSEEVRITLQKAYPDAKIAQWEMCDPSLLYYIDGDGCLCYTVDGDGFVANLLRGYGEELHLEEEEDANEDLVTLPKDSVDIIIHLSHKAQDTDGKIDESCYNEFIAQLVAKLIEGVPAVKMEIREV